MTALAATSSTKFRTAFISVALLCCISGLLFQSSRVLCVGVSGHRQIEAAIRACCAQPAKSQAAIAVDTAQMRTSSESDSHCGGCVDIPLASAPSLNSPPLLRVVPPDFQPQNLVLCAVPTCGVAYDAVPPSLPLAERSRSSLTARSLRATVIRI